MEILKKIAQKSKDNAGKSGVTVAFLGDSVTQGCFEVYLKSDNTIETVFDQSSAIHTYFKDMLSVLYPSVPVNIINAGISGDNAPHGLSRLEDDVLCHKPDLTVVAFGLNDCMQGKDNVSKYTTALRGIFEKVQVNGSELIYMTSNMMNTEVSCHIKEPNIREIAKNTMNMQNNGILEYYFDEAKKACSEMGVIVCDCYSCWKAMHENGVDVTELLANRINHPTRQMNKLSAIELIRTIFEK